MMSRHLDDDRLQDFSEGLLPPAEAERARSHLAGCPRCRRELEVLGELLDGLGGLPQEAQPSRDLWPQIAWRIGAGERVEIDLLRVGEGEATGRAASLVGGSGAARAGTASRTRARGGRWVTLPAWQLLAASLALALVSGGAVWAFLSRGGDPAAPVAQAPGGAAVPVGWEDPLEGYSAAVTDLQAILERGREVLDPETVTVLEESLRAVDDAIAEARSALENDPSSRLLRRLLAGNLRRKVDLLRHAAAVVYANT
jgi:hypothetical protein